MSKRVKELELEIAMIKELEAIEKKQASINNFEKLRRETDDLKIDIEGTMDPYDEQISLLKEERDEAVEDMQYQLRENLKVLHKTCPHINTNTRTESSEGGYLDRGWYATILNCDFCGLELDRNVVDTGYA